MYGSQQTCVKIFHKLYHTHFFNRPCGCSSLFNSDRVGATGVTKGPFPSLLRICPLIFQKLSTLDTDHRLKQDFMSSTSRNRVARFIFSKKAKPSVKKGQKWPTKLPKNAKHPIKKGQKRAKPFT